MTGPPRHALSGLAVVLWLSGGAASAQDMADSREFAGRFYDYCVRDFPAVERIAARARNDKWTQLFVAAWPDTPRYKALLGPLKDARFTIWGILGKKPTYTVAAGSSGGLSACIVQVNVDAPAAIADTARLLSAKEIAGPAEIAGERGARLWHGSMVREGHEYVLHAVDNGGRFLDFAIMTKSQ